VVLSSLPSFPAFFSFFPTLFQQKGETPLIAGSSRGLLSIVQELVESGANRNLADNVRTQSAIFPTVRGFWGLISVPAQQFPLFCHGQV
jgi:hypothetical protein